MIDMDSRLRVARGIATNETLASIEVFRTLRRCGHPHGPPPTISDGWGGIDEAMIEVYGTVPDYCGRGRPPAKKRAGSSWNYLQMVKQRDERGRVNGVKLRVQFGKKSEVIALLGKSTAYIERSSLTSRLFNGRQVRKTPAFSNAVAAYRAAAAREDCHYNLVRPHKSLRLLATNASSRTWQPRTPAMAAEVTDQFFDC
jgi:hypothetical protein